MKQLDTILRGRFPTSFFFGSLRGIIGLVLIVRLGNKHRVGFIALLYRIFHLVKILAVLIDLEVILCFFQCITVRGIIIRNIVTIKLLGNFLFKV